MLSRVSLVAALIALPALAAPALASPGAPTAPTAATRTSERLPAAVVERRVIGHSVRGRELVAWRVGRPGNHDKAVIMSTMHGDERQTRQILLALKDGAEIRGIDMWLIPTYNPDGYARGTRKNARGVDLNRNFPYRWADLDGSYESGPRAASEPETRAVMRFLRDDQAEVAGQLPPAPATVSTPTPSAPSSPAGWRPSSTCRASRSPAAVSATAP